MSGYLQGPDGRFLGSVGAGKTSVPTPSDTPAIPDGPVAERGSNEADVTGMYQAYLSRRQEIDREVAARDVAEIRAAHHAVLDDRDASEADIEAAWDWYVEHDTVQYRVRDGVEDLGPRILAHPNCPERVLDAASLGPLDANLDWARVVAAHRNTTSAIVDSAAHFTLEAADDPRREAEMAAGTGTATVFANPDLPVDWLTQGAACRSSQIRMEVAANPSTPHQVARVMAMREDNPHVIAALRRRFRRTGDEDSLAVLRARSTG